MPTYATPGVIIEEVTGPGVIAGVGTSTGGFIGAALEGPVGQPKRVTSWEDFLEIYGRQGAQGVDVYPTAPIGYLPHAVQGFFDNGGRIAWIVRAGTAKHAFRNLPPRSGGGASLRLEALEASAAGNDISVEVDDAKLADGLEVARPTATITDARARRIVVTTAAADFRVGDTITRDNTNERQVIERIQYATNEIFLEGDLIGTYTDGTLRIADLQAGQRSFRLADSTGLRPGAVATLRKGTGTPETVSVGSVSDDFVTLDRGLSTGYAITGAAIKVTSSEFDLTIRRPGFPDETFTGLSLNPRHPGYYARAITSQHVRAVAPPTPPTAPPPGDMPIQRGPDDLELGADDDRAQIGPAEIERAVDAFDEIDDVNVLSLTDVQDADTQTLLIDHCVRKGDRFAVLHTASGLDVEGALAHRAEVESERGFAALYYPWIAVRDPLDRSGGLMLVPPSGHVAGVFARVDTARGVHKAPANEIVRGALALERALSDPQQELLNPEGVNAIRVFPGQARPVIWGARTTVAPDVTDWVYVNVRRLLLYIEESIQEALRWAVFETNDLALWQKLKRTITAFLTGVWRDGALFGATAEEAFEVRIDEALNRPASRALGRLFVEIKVAPVRPAEFIVVRIGLWEGGGEVSES
jgi:uncharacterized protein